MKLMHADVRKVLISLLILSALVFGSGTTISSRVSAQGRSLYQRVGGYDVLASITDDFIGRLVSDKQFEKFFAGFSNDSKKRIRQHLLDQLCAATGGPCVYMGRDMKTTHGGLGITEDDWKVAVNHLTASFDKAKVHKKEKDELLALVSSLKKDIVEK